MGPSPSHDREEALDETLVALGARSRRAGCRDRCGRMRETGRGGLRGERRLAHSRRRRDARVDVLVWLRGRGSSGERAASLLTKGFPERTAAVPVLVRVAKVDGVRAVIVVEAIGETNGPLDARRLWVFEYSSGRLVSSSTYR
jgi:hypothetical protein